MRIGVIGAGYVGLVTSAVFADLGNHVLCHDKDEGRIEMLKGGVLPIYEPGLEEMIQRNMKEGRLEFVTDLEKVVDHGLVIFIAVGTPSLENGNTDLQQVEETARGIAAVLKEYRIIVNKSTVPVGTGDVVRRIIEAERLRPVAFDVVSNPEFLREGSAIQDALNPDRIIIGAPNPQVAMVVVELYTTLGCPILVTDVPTAEIIKYASNTFLAMKISFINVLADLCEATGADVENVRKGIGLDHRIGPHFLSAGIGYGGSCFPKDVKSLIHTTQRFGLNAELFIATDKINEERTVRFCARIENVLRGLAGRDIAVLGLSFKPDTDDLRESRALKIIRRLHDAGARVRVYDPVAIPKARNMIGDAVIFAESPYDAARGADAVVVATEWREFRQLDLEHLRQVMRGPYLFDGRNIYNPERVAAAGFIYYPVGRRVVMPKGRDVKEAQ